MSKSQLCVGIIFFNECCSVYMTGIVTLEYF